MLLAVLAGYISLHNMRRESFPPVNIGTVVVSTIYPGSSAKEVNDNVTQIIEDEIRQVAGLKDVSSVSQAGRSQIIIRIDIDNYDTSVVLQDIQEAVDRASPLPENLPDDPYVQELKSSEFPVFKMALVGPNENRQRDALGERFRDRLELVRGVSAVSLEGYSDREFHVLLDRDKMESLHVGIQEVITALSNRVRNIPAGYLELGDTEKLVRITGKTSDISSLEDIVIRSNFEGQKIVVSDIASVQDVYEEKLTQTLFNGEPAISVVVVKNQNADVIDTVDRIFPEIERFRSSLPEGFSLDVYLNEAESIQAKLDVAITNAMIGFVLVVVFLLVFFPSVAGIVTAMGLPLVALTTLGIMPLIGADFNKVTLLAIIITLGLIVDNAIVVSENFVRLVHSGMSKLDAAKQGVAQFWLPITATAMTTVAAFMPMIVTKGVMGDFIKYIPYIVTVALIVSLVECFLLLPARLRFSKISREDQISHSKDDEESLRDSGWFGAVQDKFERFIRFTLRFRYLSVLAILGIVLGSCAVQKNYNYFDVFPAEDVQYYFARAEAAPGTSMAKTTEMMNEFRRRVYHVIEQEYGEQIINNSVITVGNTLTNVFDTTGKYGDNTGSVWIDIPLEIAVKTDTPTFLALLRKVGKNGFESVYWEPIADGPPVGKALEVTLSSDNEDQLMSAVASLKSHLNSISGVLDVEDDNSAGVPEINFELNHELLNGIGLSLSDVGFALRAALDGNVASNVNVDGENIDIRVRYDSKYRTNVDNILATSLMDRAGNLIQISNIAKVKESLNFPKIKRYQYKRAISVSADVDNDAMNSVKLNQLVRQYQSKAVNDFPDVTYSYLGQDESTKESVSSLMQAFLFAIFGIFIILIFLFDSYSLPLVVLLSIPLGLVGVFLSFFAHGRPLSFFAIVGIVGLSGVVVNDSIILVSFIQELKAKGKLKGRDLLARVTSARLKPVLVTTLTTVGGLLPTAYGLGGYDSTLIPLTLAMGWGLMSGTLLVLITVPNVLAVKDDVVALIKKPFKRD
jgi:multidrug efflux pump subunit AcrB